MICASTSGITHCPCKIVGEGGVERGHSLSSVTHLPTLLFADNHISQLPDEMWRLPQLHTLDLRNNDLNALPCTLGFSPALTRVTLEGNPLRTMRRSLVSGSVQALKAFLRSRATPEQEDACEEHLARGSHMPGTSAAAREVMYSGGEADPAQWGGRFDSHTAQSKGTFSAAEDVRTAVADGVLNLSGRQLQAIPVQVWQLLQQANDSAVQAQAAAADGRRIGPDGSVLSGGALVFGSQRSGYSGREVAARGASSVTSLDLSNNQLSDSENGDTEHVLPSTSAVLLDNITLISLAGCPLSLLPPCIGQFAHLRVLDVSGTRVRWESLDGALMQPDAQLGMAPAPACSSLKELRAASSGLRRLPSALAYMAALETLDLSHNGLEVEEDVDDELLLLPSLRVCNLGGNKLAHVPLQLMALPRLSQLNLENNELRNIPPALATCTQLKTLTLSGNPTRSVRPAVLMQACPSVLAFLAARLEPGDRDAARVWAMRAELEEHLQVRDAAEQRRAASQAAAAADAAYEASVAPKIGSGAAAHSQVAHNQPKRAQAQEMMPHGAAAVEGGGYFTAQDSSRKPPAADLGRFRAGTSGGGGHTGTPGEQYHHEQRTVSPAFGTHHGAVSAGGSHAGAAAATAAAAAAGARAPIESRVLAPVASSSWLQQELVRKMTQVEGQLDSGGASKAKVFALKKDLARLRADLLKLRRG